MSFATSSTTDFSRSKIPSPAAPVCVTDRGVGDRHREGCGRATDRQRAAHDAVVADEVPGVDPRGGIDQWAAGELLLGDDQVEVLALDEDPVALLLDGVAQIGDEHVGDALAQDRGLLGPGDGEVLNPDRRIGHRDEAGARRRAPLVLALARDVAPAPDQRQAQPARRAVGDLDGVDLPVDPGASAKRRGRGQQHVGARLHLQHEAP
jgi:hypothetical protein